jgi:hypothetical protein
MGCPGTLKVGLLALLLAAGCASTSTVYTGERTPEVCGGIRMYGTEHPPFAYDEIAVHTLVIDTGSQSKALEAYADQIRKLGADAVVGFRMRPLLTPLIVAGAPSGVPNALRFELSGVAVRRRDAAPP